MNATKNIMTLLMAMLVVTAGAGAATAASIDTDETTVDATLDDGTVDLTVETNSTGVENVSVIANDKDVGTTDANGSLTFETNATEELVLELTKDNTTIERTYTIDNGTLVEADGEEIIEEESTLDATASYDNGTVSVTVTKNGSAVENVSVTANGNSVGTTDANGSLTFETNATEELTLEFTKGDMELVQTYTIENGDLVPQEDEEDTSDKSLSANENASDRAHSVLAVVQNFLNSGGEGNLGQQIQEALGDDRGNSENAGDKGNADEAKGNSENASDKGNADEAKGNSNNAKGNSNNAGGNGNGNGHGDNGKDKGKDKDEEETETESDS